MNSFAISEQRMVSLTPQEYQLMLDVILAAQTAIDHRAKYHFISIFPYKELADALDNLKKGITHE